MTTNNTNETVTTEDKNPLSTDTSVNSDEPVSVDNTTVIDLNVPQPLSTDTTTTTTDGNYTNNESKQAEVTSENINDDNQKEEQTTLPVSTTIVPPVVNDEVKSEVSSISETNNTESKLFPTTPTNSIAEQEKFNEIARKSFSKLDSDEQANSNVSTVITTSDDTNNSETIKSKKSPAPILKTSVENSKKVQTSSDTVINLETPPNVAQISTEEKVDINTEPELVSPPPETSADTKQTKTTATRTPLLTVLSTVFLFFLAIVEVIIGWTYADSCPIHWRIPHYLYIAGIVGLVLLLAPYSKRIVKTCLKPTANQTNSVYTLVNVALNIIWILLSFFLMCWFIAGCIWVFRVYSEVTYTNPHQSDYCHPVLYRFAFWLLLLTILYIVFIIFVSLKAGRQLMNVRKNKAAYSACATKE